MSSTTQTSDLQLAANRHNAQSSTGPRTESGKARTRLNGLRHGLTGQTVVMPYEDREAYDRFCAETLATLEPAAGPETALAQSIADATWRFNRARAIEENIFSLAFELANPEDETGAALAQAKTWLDHAREINLLTLYAGRIARNIDKLKRELSDLQAQRKHAELQTLEEAIELTELAHALGESFNPADFPEGECRIYPGECGQPGMSLVNGFAFSTEEIARIIHLRQRRAQAFTQPQTQKKAA